MDKSIESISIQLRPHDFGDGGLMELRVSITVGGLKHSVSSAITEDDMTSRFDYYFDHARESLRQAISARTAQSPAAAQQAHLREFGKS